MQLTVTLVDETGFPLDLLGTTLTVNGNLFLLLDATSTYTIPNNTQVTLEVDKPGYNSYSNTVTVYDDDVDIKIKIVPIINDVNDPDYKKPYPYMFFIYEPCTYNVHVYNATSTPEGDWSYYLNNVLEDSGSKNTVVNLFAAKTSQIKQRIYVKDNQTQAPLWDQQYATIQTGNAVIGVVQDISVYLLLDPVENINVETYEFKPELSLSASQETGCSDDEACYNDLSPVIVTPDFVLNTQVPSKIIFSSLETTLPPVTDVLWGTIDVLQNVNYGIEVSITQNTTDMILRVTDAANVDIIAPIDLAPGVNNAVIPTGANAQIKILISNTDGLANGVIGYVKLTKPAYFKCPESILEYNWYDFENALVQGPEIFNIDNENPQLPVDLQSMYIPEGIGDYKVVAKLTNCCTSCTKELIIPVCSFYKITETGCNEITIQNCSIDKIISIPEIIDANTNEEVVLADPYPIEIAPGESYVINFGKDGIFKITIQYGDPTVTKYVSVTMYCNLKTCLSEYMTDILCDECDCECGGVSAEKVYFLNKLVVSSFAYFMNLNNEYGFNNIYDALEGPDNSLNDSVNSLLDLEFVKKKMDKYCKNKDCGKKNPCGCK